MDRERAGGAPGQAGRAAEVLMLLSACSSPFCSPSPTCHLSPPSPCPVAPFGIVQTMNLSALLSPEPGKEPCPMTPMSPQGGQRSVLMRGGGRGGTHWSSALHQPAPFFWKSGQVGHVSCGLGGS